jgi:hypothetical protein
MRLEDDDQKKKDEEEEARARHLHLARLPAPRSARGAMSAGERAALETETADLQADATRRNARTQEEAFKLDAKRAAAAAARKTAFVKGVEERLNDPARPQTLILNGDYLDWLQEHDLAPRVLLQDDRLRRLPPTTTIGTLSPPDHHSGGNSGGRETFAYDTTHGEALRFRGISPAASRRWRARWSAAMTRR